MKPEQLVSRRARRVTQRDIAQIVGVSSATVSYACNGHDGVSDELRERILSVGRELGFRPNRAARGLRLGRMNMIGLLLADVGNPFYAELASGVVGDASEAGVQVFLAQAGLGGAMQADAARTLVDHGCDGLIFSSVVDSDLDILLELQREGVPFVFANRRVDGVDVDWVHIDDYAAAAEACELLLSTGCRRVAVLGGPSQSSASRARNAGAVETLSRSGLRVTHKDFVDGQLTRESGRKRAEWILGGHDAPNGIVCGNDMIALGVMDVCHERGIRIPADVAVIGFDDMSFASAGPLQLTTVSVPRVAMGSRAGAMLRERIAGYDGPGRHECLPYNLQIRATTRRAQQDEQEGRRVTHRTAAMSAARTRATGALGQDAP